MKAARACVNSQKLPLLKRGVQHPYKTSNNNRLFIAGYDVGLNVQLYQETIDIKRKIRTHWVSAMQVFRDSFISFFVTARKNL